MAVDTKQIGTRTLQGLVACLIALGGCVTPAGTAMPGMHGSGQNATAVFEKLQAKRAARNAAAAQRPAQAPPTPGVGDLLSQGDRARDDGDLASALFAYLRAHRAAEGASWAAAARIGYLHLRNEPLRSEALFERLVAEHPDVSQLHTGLALARLAQSRAADARAPLERAVALDPQAATPRNVIGVLLDRLGDHAAAQEQYRAAHALRPSDPAILNNLGVSLLLSGQAREAAQALRQALHNAPGDHATRNNLAVALALDDQIAEAFTLFADSGGEARAHNNLGYVLYLRGEHTRALQHFERALGVPGEELHTVLANLERTQTALVAGTGPTWHPAQPQPLVAVAEVTETEPAVEIAETIQTEPAVEIAETTVSEPALEIAETIVTEPALEIAETTVTEPALEIAETIVTEPAVEIAEVPEPLVPIREIEVELISARAAAPLMLAPPPVRRVELSLDVPRAEPIEAPAAAGFASRSFNEILEALLGPAGPQLPHAQIERFDPPTPSAEAPVAALDPTAG